MADQFEVLWVYGVNPFPGGCDPTYAFQWAANQLIGMYPELNKAKPVGLGFRFLPYSTMYDSEIMLNNLQNIKIQ